jgi:hypothetical protein
MEIANCRIDDRFTQNTQAGVILSLLLRVLCFLPVLKQPLEFYLFVCTHSQCKPRKESRFTQTNS